MSLISDFIRFIQNALQSTTGLVLAITALITALIGLIAAMASLRSYLSKKRLAETKTNLQQEGSPGSNKQGEDSEPSLSKPSMDHDGLITGSLDDKQKLTNLKNKASQLAYAELHQLNEAQQKVTEEELRNRTTAAAVEAKIASLPGVYGNPERALKTFIEVYSRIWREGGAVVSLLERTAILKAQENKRKDTKWGTVISDTWLVPQATVAAIEYITGEEFITQLSLLKGETPPVSLTEGQQAQLSLYAETYIKAYRLYKVPSRIPKIFG